MHDEDVRRIRDHRHRREILHRIERQRRIDARADRERTDVGEQQRVAIGRGLGDDLRADVAVGAGLVLDDDRLAPRFRELLADRAREDVRRAARRVRHDDADRLCGIGLRVRRRCKRRRHAEQDDGNHVLDHLFLHESAAPSARRHFCRVPAFVNGSRDGRLRRDCVYWFFRVSATLPDRARARARERRARASRGPLAARAVGDLVPAARAVGDDQRVGVGRRAPPAAATAPPSHRHVVVRGLVAEAAGHAAAARLDDVDARAPGTSRSTSTRRRHRVERLLMAMAVQQRARLRQRREAAAAAGPPRARARGTPRSASRGRASSLRRVAEAHAPGIRRAATAGTTARARRSARRARRAGASAAIRRRASRLRLVDEPRGEDTCGRSTAVARLARRRARDRDAIARRAQHAQAPRAHSPARSSCVNVSTNSTTSASSRSVVAAHVAQERVAAPARQRAPRGEAEPPLGEPREPRPAIAQVEEPRQRAPPTAPSAAACAISALLAA